MEDITGQTGGVHPGYQVFAVADLAANQGNVCPGAEPGTIDMDIEVAIVGRQPRRGDTPYGQKTANASGKQTKPRSNQRNHRDPTGK